MHAFEGILDIVILLGAVQGLIFSSLLFFSKKNRGTCRLLASLIFLIALASLKLYGTQAGWFALPLFRLIDAFVPMIVIMPVGPLIYFYVRSVLYPGFRLTKKDRVHFYPVFIDLVPQLTAITFVICIAFRWVANNPGPWGYFIDTYNVYADLPRWGSLSFYVWMAGREIAAARKANAGRPAHHSDQLSWLGQLIRLLLVFQCIWLIYLVPYCIPAYTDVVLNHVDWYPVYVPLAILIYWMGIRGYLVSRSHPADIPPLEKTSPVRAAPSSPAAAFSGVLAAELIEALKSAMENDKLYLNPALNLSLLSAHTGIVPKNISAVLNGHLQKTFSEFVNEYRINAIKDKMLSGEGRYHTIAGMAYDCGFNSLPTFQRAFKTFIGLTPKEFLSKNAGSPSNRD